MISLLLRSRLETQCYTQSLVSMPPGKMNETLQLKGSCLAHILCQIYPGGETRMLGQGLQDLIRLLLALRIRQELH